MKNELWIEEPVLTRIREFADSGKTPCYVYDTRKIRKNCQDFLNIVYTPRSIHYAMMANSNPQFLQIVRESGIKIFVNSLDHLQVALDLHFKSDEIIFAASAMDEPTMRHVNSVGARLILDSIGQFELWQSLFPSHKVGIRCNIGELIVPRETTGGYFLGSQSRLGLSLADIDSLKGNPAISGLHIYVGTNISDIDHFLECYKQVADLAQFFPKLEYIDFGGGFGTGEKIIDAFDMLSYGHRVTELMNEISLKAGRKICLVLEPGRIIGGDAGYFVCKITDIKRVNDQQLLGVNASCVQFPRPLFYPESASHPVVILNQSIHTPDQNSLASSVYGCSTYSRDYLARNVDLPPAHIGDIVILGLAGSYCSAAHTSFLGFPRAMEYFI